MEIHTVDPGFWAGKKVLVTGHTGFKGSWLALWLQTLGSEVVGFSRGLPTEPALFELGRVSDGMASVVGDIRDFDALSATMREHRPEIVFHLAALPLVRQAFRQPLAAYETNVMGTVHLLEAVRQSEGVRAVVNVTTDKCYENREWEWAYREYEPKGGFDPYSSSKACSELVTDAYRKSYFTDADGPLLASARAGNVIGGGDWAEDRLVPDMMRAAMAGGTVPIRNPAAIRPWQHVLNPLSGYLLLAQSLWDTPASADGWNFGPEERDAQPVSWVADRLIELWGGGLRWEADGQPQPHEAHYLKLDSSRARLRLGWVPRWDLEIGLQRTIEWFRAFSEGDDMQGVTLGQIREHHAAATAGASAGG